MPSSINSPFFLSKRTQIPFRVAACPGKRIFSQMFVVVVVLVNEMQAKVLVLLTWGEKRDC